MFLLFLSLLFSNVYSFNFRYGQEIDSLENKFKIDSLCSYNDAIRVGDLLKSFSLVKAKYYYDKSYSIALDNQNYFQINTVLLKLLDLYRDGKLFTEEEKLLTNMLSSISSDKKDKIPKETHISQFHLIKNDTISFYIYLRAAQYYEDKNMLKDAEKYLDMAHTIAFKLYNKNPEFKIFVYYSFAKLRLQQNKLAKATAYLNQIVSNFDIALQESELAWNYSEIGNIFYKNNFYVKAENNYNKAIQLFIATNDSLGCGINYFNIAKIKNDQGNQKEYFNNIKKSLGYLESYKHNSLNKCYLKILSHLITNFYKNKQYDLAILHIKQFISLFSNPNEFYELKMLSNYCKILKDCYEKKNDYEKALKYYAKYIKINDSIALINSSIRVDELKLHYEAIDQKRQNDILNRENDTYRLELTKGKFFRYLLIGIIILTFILTFILIILFYVNRRINRLLEKKVRQRTSELEEKNKKLNIAYSDVKKSNEIILKQDKLASLGTMVAGIAHEINNPGQAIKFSLQGMQLNVEDLRNLLKDIKNIIFNPESDIDVIKNKIIIIFNNYDFGVIFDELDDMVNDNLNSIDRIEHIVKSTKRMSYQGTNIEDCSLVQIIEDVIILLGNMIKNQVQIVFDIEPDLPIIRANPNDIGQVFINLVNNSVDAIKEKKLYIKESEIKIKANYLKDINKIKIVFSDNGSGIDKSIQDKIFDPFFTTKSVGKGTGLGLNIVYKIITGYNGQIIIESKKGIGSKFIIWLPVSGRR